MTVHKLADSADSSKQVSRHKLLQSRTLRQSTYTHRRNAMGHRVCAQRTWLRHDESDKRGIEADNSEGMPTPSYPRDNTRTPCNISVRERAIQSQITTGERALIFTSLYSTQPLVII